ncbi:MAG: hypothetical protein AB1767_11450 [Bacillota bacterium]
MKKLVAVLLVVSILGSGLPAGLAQDYHGQVLEYLAGQLQVEAGEISLDGSLIDLPFSGEQLWGGRYYLKGEGEEVDPGVITEDPGMPDDVVSDPERSVSYDLKAGAVYLRVKTGEILTYDGAQIYFDEEQKLQQRELEELSKDAGKIDPYLYRQLIQAAATQKFEVIIWAKYKDSAAIQAAMEAVYQEYPEFSRGDLRTLPILTDPGVIEGGGNDSNSGVEPLPLPRPLPADGVGEGTVVPSEKPDILPYEIPSDFGDTDWARFEEMENKLAQIGLQGYQENLDRLKSELEAMGVGYEVMEGGIALRTEMTVAQVLSLKDSDYIESISEEMMYALDGMERTAGTLALKDSAGKEGNLTPWLLGAALILLAGAGFYLFIYRKNKLVKE